MKALIAVGVVLVGLWMVFGWRLIFGGSRLEIDDVAEMPMTEINPSPTVAVQSEVDWQAGFAIFTRGTFRVFTAAMYHNQSDEVFLEGRNPNLVVIKRSGITWGDFFETLPMKLTDECLTTGTGMTFCSGEQETLKFFVNGHREDNFLNREIKDGDKALISFGEDGEGEIARQMSRIADPN